MEMAENVVVEDKDYLYKLLGCDELSSEEQIIAEYKTKAKALHPDKNSGGVETTEEFITYVFLVKPLRPQSLLTTHSLCYNSAPYF